MSDTTGRTILVTGAAGNLGRAVAEAFLATGASLVLVDRAPDRLPQLYPQLVDDPAHLLATSVDMGDPEAVQAMVDRAIERLGHIDALANTVGGYRAGTPVHETPLELWDAMHDLNVRTALIITRAVVPPMLERGSGAIIHVASRAGLRGSRNAAAYSASKSALIRLVESASEELKRAGVNVNCVLPGTIDTPQNRRSMPRADYSKWVTPEAIAGVILFLASDAARAIHGASIPVYGTG